MRRLLKFGHTLGAIGLTGAMAALLVMLAHTPPPSLLPEYAAMRGAMGAVATWIFFPSLGVTLLSGILSIAAVRAFHGAGWVWLKAATGILVFESGFVGVLGPMQQEARQSAAALAGRIDPTMLTGALAAERNTLWVLMIIALLNVALGIWRPRLTRRPA